MALIAEFEINSGYAEAALAAAPALTLNHEDIYLADPDRFRWAFWAEGGDFEAALVDDPTVASFDVLTELHDRRLYETTAANDPEEEVYWFTSEHGVQMLDVTRTLDRAVIRVRAPTLTAFREVKRRCEEWYGTFVTHPLFQEADGSGQPTTLTAKQPEALRLALDAGYFDIPRGTTLEELADDLDISEKATSERLWRGVHALVADACGP